MLEPRNLMSFSHICLLTHSPRNRLCRDPRHASSITCDVISFDGQGQLCPLTCTVQREEIFQSISD